MKAELCLPFFDFLSLLVRIIHPLAPGSRSRIKAASMSDSSGVPSTPFESRLTSPDPTAPIPIPTPPQTLPENPARRMAFAPSSLPSELTKSFGDEARQQIRQLRSNCRQRFEHCVSDEETEGGVGPAQFRGRRLLQAGGEEDHPADDEYVSTLSRILLQRKDQHTLLSTRGYEPIKDLEDSSAGDSAHDSTGQASTLRKRPELEENLDEPNYVWSRPEEESHYKRAKLGPSPEVDAQGQSDDMHIDNGRG